MQIKAENLQYQYDAGQNLSFPDFDLGSGEKLLILGQSGVGKSTLLHLLGLLLNPTAGNIAFEGQSFGGSSAKQINHFRAQNIGIIFQKPHFVQSLNVLENINLANFLAQKPSDRAFVDSLILQLGLLPYLHKKTYELSLGEQQRVGILRALATKPKLLLADEPTSSLDDGNCQKVLELLHKLSADIKASLIVVTHDQRLKASFQQHLTLAK